MELGKGDESFKCFLSWLKNTIWHLIRPNKKNKCVSGNRYENFRQGRHIF